jgi:ligand-binding sensor domain-containing protein
MMRSGFIFFIGVFMQVQLHAQVLSVKNYTTANGLTNNRTGTVCQDGLGYIWIGTDYGICRYDGKTMKYIPLPGTKNYYTVSCSRRYKQYVLFSTGFGVALCCGDSIIAVNASPRRRLHTYESIALNDSVFLVANSDGLICLQKDKPSTYIPLPFTVTDQSDPLVLFRDGRGNIWFGVSDRTIFYKNGDLTKPLVLPQFNGMYLNIIKGDPAGNVYVGTDKGLFRFKKDRLDNPIQPAEKLFTVNENIISGLAFDSTGHAWMSNRYGVRKFSDDFKKNVLITPANGLASFNTWDAFCDRENNMWFATENGVSKIINTPVVNYSFPSNEFPNIKTGLVWDDSTFYYSNGVGLKKIVNDKVIDVSGFHDEAGFLEERLWKTPDKKILVNLNRVNNLIFYGVDTRVYRPVKDAIVSQSDGGIKWNTGGYINLETAFNDREGNMWYGREDGMALYKNNRIRSYTVRDKKGHILPVDAVTRDRNGDLWLAGNKNIVRCHVFTQGDSVSVQPFEILDTVNGLNKQGYLKILFDSHNRIWAGGADGMLTKIELEATGKIKSLKNYAPPEISSIRITDLLENDNGDIWVGTAAGIDIFSTDAAGNISIRKDAYGSELCGKTIFFLKKQQHKIYVGTTGCMAVIDLTEKNIPAPAPQVFINGIRIGNTESEDFLHTENYRLSPDSNTISFYFNATSFLNAGVKYKYMLEGVDANWSTPTEANNITYTQLPPGVYTFKVSAQNGDGVWSVYPAQKTFTVGTPWYKAWWFWLLCAIVFFYTIYAVYRYRVNQIKKLHIIRENISNDLHDDIGSTLSSITVMSNLLKQKIETNPEQSAALASQIEDSGRQMIYAMSDIVWSIKPGNDTLEQLINRLREYMNIMLEGTMEDYALITEGNISSAPIDMYLRRDIYLTCKEIIHNTAKYAEANSLVMRISTNGGVHIHSKDDGKGFDFERVKKGNGLNNIFMRVQANKGTVNCITAPGSGTEWDIHIPL